ncbi:hypothetical protein SAMN05444008_101125 [Cnuella takakiae]|uniref:DUF2892 domain-containing protein n=1 Tax=Cnuella takakiae TaxID=1302690 RepID=A0A1M4SHA5_9BACT|nr:hypothetical protein [Cnuella takakiae]OLY94507.1 hypothetical protein BUE76_23510 [Cnuella takakiae]SHE31569.1 hypothetical protein SAMN05444008_101125 [Cnuella takakiae]
MQTIDLTRKVTPKKVNQKIDAEIEQSLQHFQQQSPEAIEERIAELDTEWDVSRMLGLNAAVLSLSGVILAATVHKKWLWLPGVVTSFLIQHSIQGWCPPIALFRQLGVRSRQEIDREKYALRDILRGRGADTLGYK